MSRNDQAQQFYDAMRFLWGYPNLAPNSLVRRIQFAYDELVIQSTDNTRWVLPFLDCEEGEKLVAHGWVWVLQTFSDGSTIWANKNGAALRFERPLALPPR